MGQKSSIDRLPENLRTKLIELLQNPAVTQKEIVELINAEASENVVSKSSVNRYKLRMDKFAAKTREAERLRTHTSKNTARKAGTNSAKSQTNISASWCLTS